MLKFITVFIPILVLGIANYFSIRNYMEVKNSNEYKEHVDFLDLELYSFITFLTDILAVIVTWIILVGIAWN